MLAKFWWGADAEHRKIHWISWKKLSKPKTKGGLGFRGFRDFNYALLGKHCWRLASMEGSLLGEVLKSRYYPRGNFLEAVVGYQPSYVWRSILNARKILVLGSKWTIGNGQNTRIWMDRWVGDGSLIKSKLPLNSLEDGACVARLIDMDLMHWNVPLVNHYFAPDEARKIISTPLSLRLPRDKLCWKWEKNGVYSVKTAYHALYELSERDLASSSTPKDESLWKEIWHSNIPSSARNFLWHLAEHILPTRSNLSKKGILLDRSCPLCHVAMESHSHLFMSCNFSRAVMFSSSLGAIVPAETDLQDWLLKWLSCCDEDGAQLFSILLWKIWQCRNETVFRNSRPDPASVSAAAVCFLQDFNAATSSRSGNSSIQQAAAVPVVRLSAFRVFVDAGCFPDGSTCWGLCILDVNDGIIYSASKKDQIVVDPTTAEVLGLRWGIQTAIQRGILDVLFFSDAQVVVNCVLGKTKVAIIDPIIDDCLMLLKELPNSSVHFVNRDSNCIAHSLVAVANRLGCNDWLGLPSVDILCNNFVMPVGIFSR